MASNACRSDRRGLPDANVQCPGAEDFPRRYDLTLSILTKLLEYLRQHDYINVVEYARSPMQWVAGQSQFEWLASNKDHHALFDSYMSSRRHGKANWVDFHPVDERLIDGAIRHSDAVFLVDVGGDRGHDMQRLRDWSSGNAGDLPGQPVHQDLAAEVDTAPFMAGVTEMPYSFLNPQPVKGK